MSWSPQQSEALQKAAAWAANPRAPQVFKIMGYAGTGKTTLAKELAETVGGTVLFGAYTGKASLVLRKKGCPASTLHSLMYKPAQCEVTGKVEFLKNPDSPIAFANLLVVDEVSMVGQALAQDLLSYGTKILVLGDPFQLPPVGDGGYFTEGEPDVMLTEIHRQAKDNPIIRMSMDVREGRGLQIGSYGSSRVRARLGIDRDELAQAVLSADQVICGRNQTRQTFNGRIRTLKGFTQRHPAAGERLVCLKNNRIKGLLNGGLWDVAKSEHRGLNIHMEVDSLDDNARGVEVTTRIEFFTGHEKDLDWRTRREIDEFTFGYALTCHKSQGSQWDSVLVFDEGSTFREDADRWRYTAITRAAETVEVIV